MSQWFKRDEAISCTASCSSKDEPEEFNRCLKNVEKILFRNRLPIPSIMDERSFATRARDLHIGDIKLEELNNELGSHISSDY